MLRFPLIVSLLFLSAPCFAQGQFNGMMSTFIDEPGDDMNGVIEMPFDSIGLEHSMNGVVTIYEPQPLGIEGEVNGLMDTFLDTVLPGAITIRVIEPMRSDVMPALSGQYYFEINSARLTAASRKELTALLPVLKSDGIRTITVLGYTDASGPISFNQRLSQQRADAVKAWLIANGVKNTIVSFGMGPQSSENGTPDKLRRADIMVEIK
jgi:outer membrane protein OmpA-like peptidoglycan-associated protein